MRSSVAGTEVLDIEEKPSLSKDGQVIVLVSRMESGMGGVAAYSRAIRECFGHRSQFVSIGNGYRVGVWGKLKSLIFDLNKIVKIVRSDNVRVVQVNPSLIWKAILRDSLHVLIAKAFGKKVLVFWHGWHPRYPYWLSWPVVRGMFLAVYNIPECHVVLAEAFRNDLIRLGVTAPVVCESGVVEKSAFSDLVYLPEESERRDSIIRILFLARIEKEKGIYTAISTVNELNEMGADVELVVAGEGGERIKAEKYVINRGIDGVTFLGYVEGFDKRRAYLDCDIYLFPSMREGMPLSVLEAMAHGMPVVCSRVGGLNDFFEDGNMGYSVQDPKCVNEFVESVMKIVSNPMRKKRIGERNKRFAKEHFHPKVVGRRVDRIYEALIAGHNLDDIPVTWKLHKRQGVDSKNGASS